VLCVAATITTGESQARRLGKKLAPARGCVNLGCDTAKQCWPFCGGLGSASCINHICVPQ
jgi:hypothetical protein